jgi:hypothetical protein
MTILEDPIELLLPETDESARQRARQLVRLLRLVVDDARAARAQTVGVDLPRARSELDRHGKSQIEGLLRELLRQHLDVAVPQDSCLWFGEPSARVQETWQALEEQRGTQPDLPGVPMPGESPLTVAERLLHGLERAGVRAQECDLWRARWTRLANGERAAEALFRALLERALAAADAPSARSALAGWCECLLDRGAVREARQVLIENLPRAGASTRLRVLMAWTRLALDDAAGARSALVGLKPWNGLLPQSLVELRERRREWVPMLAGRARLAPLAGPARPAAPWLDRSLVGASVLAVFVFERGAGAQCLWSDVAPGLKGALDAWLQECEGAAATSGTWAHRVVVAARSLIEERQPERMLQGVLGAGETRALFVEPILDEEGEVAGWVHVELEHHLVPGSIRRADLAGSWREAVLRAGRRVVPLRARETGPGVLDPPAESCPILRAACEELVEELGIKTAQRLWWVFDASTAELQVLASGGQAQGFGCAARGRRKALERALCARGPIAFEEPDERLSVHARAGSGVVLVLRPFGRACALLVIESSRRRDFKPSDLERLQAACDRLALHQRLAQFRSWHRQHFGHDVHFDSRRQDFREFAERLVLAARTSSPVVLSGPRGAGKQILARWLHFESPQAQHALRVVSVGAGGGTRGLRELLSGGPGTIVVEDLELAEPGFQEALVRHLESEDPTLTSERTSASAQQPRLLVTLPLRLGEAAAQGRLRLDLAQRLDRLQLWVPSLRERREDILPLVECLARRFAEEEGVRAPTFSEASLALLWRQPWEGNVRELENLVYKLVVFVRQLGPAALRPLEPEDVLHIAGHSSVELLSRLPSRHPRRSDLIAALRVSRTKRGRINKTRAALFLGWDPGLVGGRGGLGGGRYG